MPKVKLTEELASIIKITRQQYDKKASDLANVLGKSLAYVSKLENANLKSIDFETLVEIFEYLIGDETKFEEFMNREFNKLTIELTPEEIEKEDWMKIFDLELREIPIPVKLLDFINDKLTTNNLTPKDVIILMNKNIDLDEKQKQKFELYNKIYIQHHKDGSRSISIKFKLNEDFLDKILNKERTTINHITMEGIIYNLLLLENYSSNQAKNLLDKILVENNFLSLQRKYQLISDEKKDVLISDEYSKYLTEFDKNNMKHLESILEVIKLLSDWNVEYVNQRLQAMVDTLGCDASFAITLFGLEYSKLDHLENEDKKLFLKDLNSLIEKYSNITYEPTEKFEKFDF